ncbi:MAG: peptidoglycan editing factor PgeF [Nitrospirae bacterium]|nr:peptidoglycan editing factor PgeF [Nitrospirota bacterium]
MFVYRESSGIGYYEVTAWAGARGLFTTRKGGESLPPYDSLNLGAGGGDDAATVERNRARLADALGLGPRGVRTVSQVHGSDVYVLKDIGTPRPVTGFDAIITDIPGAAVGVLTADCVPILLYDPANRAVAAVHAGWAGTIKGIAGHAVEAMAREYGTDPSLLMAVVGPSIGPCCYEVDEKVVGPLREALRDWPDLVVQTTPEKWRFDLWKTNRMVLELAGVRADNISVMSLCTACNQDKFYSHRGSGGKAGRMLAVAVLT